jgi:hypothetical protein
VRACVRACVRVRVDVGVWVWVWVWVWVCNTRAHTCLHAERSCTHMHA